MGGSIYIPRGRAREYAPLALNLYAGCPHGCRYCYAPDVVRRDRVEFHELAYTRPGILDTLARDLKSERELTMDHPVLLCFTSDPYHPGDTSATREAIIALHAYGHPVHILTKGGLRAGRDFDLLGVLLQDALAATLTFTSSRDSQKWEPLAAPPEERLAMLERAHDRGITTWASLEPVIDPPQSLELIKFAAPFTDLFKVGTWNHDAQARTIDWANFGRRAIGDLEALGKPYYIKRDLYERLDPDMQAKADQMNERTGLPL